ncbi:hypothetical protein BDW68DRAFT_179437 [Aspergillus falconensis]
MPYCTSCTSPSRLCDECGPIYDELQAHLASGNITMEDLFPLARVYPISFAKSFDGNVPQSMMLPVCRRIHEFMEDRYGRSVDIYFSATPFTGSDGEPKTGISILVDCPEPMRVTSRIMWEIFEDCEDGVVDEWQNQTFEEMDICQTLPRLIFFEQMLRTDYDVIEDRDSPDE